jgi:SSS family solute:Na+ symporter
MTEKKQVLIMRVLIVVFIVISAYIALNKDKLSAIADMMGISWGALAGAFLAPFVYGLYWKKTTKASVWASFIFGAGIMILNMLIRGSFPTILQSPINSGVIAMLGGLVIVPVVSLITKKPDKALTDEMFACYNKEELGLMLQDLHKDRNFIYIHTYRLSNENCYKNILNIVRYYSWTLRDDWTRHLQISTK